MYTCENKCCTIEFADISLDLVPPRRGYYYKAGVFIYDPDAERVLLVQSRRQLWGPPKGTLESANNETNCECAIREVKEETGLDIGIENFSRATKIKNRAIYYYAEMKWRDVHPQKGNDDNDANGITWIKLNCLEECIKSGQIELNQHCKIVFRRFLNRVFPASDFVKVKRKQKRR